MKAGWIGLLLAAAVASGQSAPAGGAQALGMQIYENSELHLKFWYPAELRAQDSRSQEGRDQALQEDSTSDATALSSQACSKLLLAVGSGGNSGQRQGRITVLEVDPTCIPAKALRNRKTMQSLLKGLTSSGTTILGMMPVDQPAAYRIGDYPASFAEAQGEPVAKTDLQPANNDQTLGVVAVAVRGYILTWRLEANNPELFSRLLSSRVDFGQGKPQPLFPVGGQ